MNRRPVQADAPVAAPRPGAARRLGAALTLLGCLSLCPAPCHAETLQDALAAAYKTNPALQGQRFQQQGLDETYVQAKAGLRPTVGLNAQAQYQRAPNSSNFAQGFGSFNSGAASVVLSQPLYTGGRTTWAVRAAEASVKAGREDVRAVEGEVLMSVIQAYVDVLRDQQNLAIRQADLSTLDRQFAESSAKFTLGKVTKTDVAQAQAQLEAARASLAQGQASLEISKAEYAAAVGTSPGDLSDPMTLQGLPATIDQAFDLAEASNPLLLQSRLKEEASRAQIAVAKSAYRPTVALQGSYGVIGPVSPFVSREYGTESVASVTFALPLVTGGVTASQVRQATAQNGSDRVAIEAARRQMVQGVAQGWNQLLAGRAAVKAGEAQVKAAETALQGAQAEYGFGLRTTLDVLISDENLRAAQLSLAQSRHDVFLAEAALLQACGRLEIAELVPGLARDEPTRNFERVRNAGAPPWAPVVETLDRLGAPAAAPPKP